MATSPKDESPYSKWVKARNNRSIVYGNLAHIPLYRHYVFSVTETYRCNAVHRHIVVIVDLTFFARINHHTNDYQTESENWTAHGGSRWGESCCSSCMCATGRLCEVSDRSGKRYASQACDWVGSLGLRPLLNYARERMVRMCVVVRWAVTRSKRLLGPY